MNRDFPLAFNLLKYWGNNSHGRLCLPGKRGVGENNKDVELALGRIIVMLNWCRGE